MVNKINLVIYLVRLFFICIFAVTLKPYIMPQKMFKIGEYAKGGIIQVKITGKVIKVIGREWNHSNGGRKRQQTEANCPEWITGTELSTNHDVENKLERFLLELTTSYWSDEIIKWIKSKVEFKSDQPWLN